MVVAIDGPAGVGKSSIAKMVAERSGFSYLNSGSFYRAYTYLHLCEGGAAEDLGGLLKRAKETVVQIKDGHLFLDGIDIEDKLHTAMVDRHVAAISAYVPLRSYVNEQLVRIAEKSDVIVEGRDITTVVFPHAELKIFFDAEAEVRAQRRFLQHPDGLTFDEVLAQIIARDEIDRNKPVGALKVAEDALYVDTSHLTMEQVCEKVLSAIFARKSDSK
ncbi:MAG: (d)CMP kinase [Sphaerochaeta sp.]|jgi:cytidylate kinase|nr:(d)CMP kinase [Sphaerochaeta sp.]